MKPDSIHAQVRNFIDCCKQLFGHQSKKETLVSDLYNNVKDTDNFALFHSNLYTKLHSRSRTRFNYGPNYLDNQPRKLPSAICLNKENFFSGKESNRSKKNVKVFEGQRLTRSRTKAKSHQPFAFLHEKFNKARSRKLKGTAETHFDEVERNAKARWMETKDYFMTKCRHSVQSFLFRCFEKEFIG